MASRICPQCGQEVSRTARFCPQCALPLTGEPTIPRASMDTQQLRARQSSAIRQKRLFMLLGAAVFVLGALCAWLIVKTSLLHAPEPVPATLVVQAPAAPIALPQAAPVVSAPAPVVPTAPPVTAAPAPAPVAAPTTPPEIARYLAFVENIEQQRVALDSAEVGALLPLLGTAQSMKDETDENQQKTDSSQINQGMTSNLAKWQDLIRQFQAQTPPIGCEDLGNSYYKVLEDYTNLCSEIQVAAQNGDMGKIASLQTAQGTVDADATTADNALAAVCTKYYAKKTFAIQAEGSGSGTSLVSP